MQGAPHARQSGDRPAVVARRRRAHAVFKHETRTCWKPSRGEKPRKCVDVSAFKIIKQNEGAAPQIFEVYTDPSETTDVRREPRRSRGSEPRPARPRRRQTGALGTRLAAGSEALQMFSTYLEPIMMSDDATDFAGGHTHPRRMVASQFVGSGRVQVPVIGQECAPSSRILRGIGER